METKTRIHSANELAPRRRGLAFVPGRFLNGRMSSGVAELAGIAEAAR